MRRSQGAGLSWSRPLLRFEQGIQNHAQPFERSKVFWRRLFGGRSGASVLAFLRQDAVVFTYCYALLPVASSVLTASSCPGMVKGVTSSRGGEEQLLLLPPS